MANRYPLVVNTSTGRIAELPAGDNLDLSQSGISNVGNVNVTGEVVATGNITGDFFIGNGSQLTGITTSPAGTSGQLQYNDNGDFAGVPGVTYTSGNLNLGAVANVKVTGGSSGQALVTDGAGNLSFGSVQADSFMLRPVRAATMANMTLSSTPTVDGVILDVGDRVLVWRQTTASQNGIYIVQAGAWTRASDFNTGAQTLLGGVTVTVTAGTELGGVSFVCTNTGAITVGTTAITFQRVQNTGLISIWTSDGAFQNKAVGSAFSGATTVGLSASSSTDAAAFGYSAVAGSSGVSFGYAATSGTGGTALGRSTSASGTNSVAVGNGGTASGISSVAIGQGSSTTASQGISIGVSAGTTGAGGISIGNGAKTSNTNSISIGVTAGASAQGENAIALGATAGNVNQGTYGIAIGTGAGSGTQGSMAISIGLASGLNSQGANAIALGRWSGRTNQGANAIAIGQLAGNLDQGINSIAIGASAGFQSQAANTIVLNATGTTLNAVTTGTFIVKPIRSATATNMLYYDGTSGEISYGNIANLRIDGYEVGTKIVPQVSQSANYTLVESDSGKHILHPSADTTARTFTIPANSSVAYPIGTTITFVNQNGAGNVTIAITTDTMRLAGAGTTGSRTLAANGVATAIKIATTEWIISGVGLT